MIRPVDAPRSQTFGENPTKNLPWNSWLIQTFGNYQPDGHSGEDYACDVGTPVRAVTSGTVLHIGWMSGTYDQNPWWIAPNFAGYCAVVDHGSFIGIYGHCQDGSAKVRKGDRVTEGQVFILSGNTGGSTGPHLHFEILPDGYILQSAFYGRIDPASIFRSSLSYAGTVTPIQEEDMGNVDSISDGAAVKIADVLLDRIRGEATLGQFLTEYRGQHIDAIRVTEGIPDAILDRRRGSTLGEMVNEYRGQHIQLVGLVQGVDTGGTVDVEALAAALSEQLEARDLEALAAKLQITVKES
jgi:murein DD-endopeptidase MepM/ murein hydrolase activator NlpD